MAIAIFCCCKNLNFLCSILKNHANTASFSDFICKFSAVVSLVSLIKLLFSQNLQCCHFCTDFFSSARGLKLQIWAKWRFSSSNIDKKMKRKTSFHIIRWKPNQVLECEDCHLCRRWLVIPCIQCLLWASHCHQLCYKNPTILNRVEWFWLCGVTCTVFLCRSASFQK